MDNIWTFLYQTLSASVVALVLLVFKRLFLDKLSPRWQYCVWAVLGIKLLLPAGIFGRNVLSGGSLWLESAKTLTETQLSSALSGPFALTSVLAPVPLFPHGFPAPRSVTDVLFYLYAAGVALCLLWFLCSYLRLRFSLRRGTAPTGETLTLLDEVCARYQLRKPRRVVVLPQVGSAFVCGLLRPVLVLPEGRELDEKVLLHELLHLRHGDVAVGSLLCLLRCLHWCNPLIWYCCNRVQNDCESLCDQRVLERLKGEDRRDYGCILLSMADDRYARAPGTSSMANGGRNIRRRIAAIARFKRYPAGMALASVCVAALLVLGCLVGVPKSAALEDTRPSTPWALSRLMAQARVSRPTTVAGALDTYAKALSGNSGAYLMMVASPDLHGAMMDALAAGQNPCGDQYEQISQLGTTAWRVAALRPEADGSYSGVLIFQSLDVHNTSGDGYYRALSQRLRVVPVEGGFSVQPLEDLTVLEHGNSVFLYDSSALPPLSYRGEVGDFRVEFDYQCLLGVYNQVQNTDAMSSMFNSFWWQQDPVPKPHSAFTEWDQSLGGRIVEKTTGQELLLNLHFAPMTRAQLQNGDAEGALQNKRYQYFTLNVPEEVGNGGGGGSDPSGGMDQWRQSVPEAFAISFTWLGEPYTCIATLEGGAS